MALVFNNAFIPHAQPMFSSMGNHPGGFPLINSSSMIEPEFMPVVPVDKIPQIPLGKLPSSITTGGMTYMGVWDASTVSTGSYALGQLMFDTEQMSNVEMGLESDPEKGQFWRVTGSSGGNYPIDLLEGGVDFEIGDFLVIESVTPGLDADKFVLTFGKIDNTDSFQGITINATTVTSGVFTLNDNIDTAQLKTDAVDGDKLASDVVDTAHLKNLAVEEQQLAADAVTRHKIKGGELYDEHFSLKAVKTASIDDDAVTEGQLADLAVSTGKIVNGNVTKLKFPPNFDAEGRTMTVYVDQQPPTSELLYNTTTNPVACPVTQTRYSESSGLNYLEVVRGSVTEDIEFNIRHRVTLPHNFAGFKLSNNHVQMKMLLDIETGQGDCEVEVMEVFGFESTANARDPPILEPLLTSGNSETSYSTQAITWVNEPTNGLNATLKPGESFLVNIHVLLSHVGATPTQRVSYGGLKFDYLYQV